MPVILFHAGVAGFSGGFVGVDVFFVISGYLITSIIHDHLRAGDFSLLSFYERRARRILPALFFVVAVCLPLAWVILSPLALQEFSKSVMAVPVFASNILFWRETGYFERASELKPLLHTWSLAVEEQYYLVFPLFMALLWRFGRRFLVPGLVCVALVSFALAQWASIRYPTAAFFLLPTRGWELLFGALVALYLAKRPAVPGNQILSLFGLVLIALAAALYDEHTPFPGIHAAAPVVGTCLVILFAREGTLVHRLLSSRVLVFIGLISYSAYLWHQPLFAFYRSNGAVPVTTPGMLALALLAFVLAWGTWKFIENPFRRGSRVPSRWIPGLAIAASATVLAIGLAGLLTNGFIDRYHGIRRGIAEAEFIGGSYVIARFDALQNVAFDPDVAGRKVVLVGDSYAKDIINAVFEAGLNEQFQFSTWFIPADCGNLYLETDFSDRIEPGLQRDCAGLKRYTDPRLIDLLRGADEVWLASSWRDWQVDLLAQTVQNLETEFDLRVVVFGRKNFGWINIAELLRMSDDALLARSNPMERYQVETNRRMKAALDPAHFVDVSDLMCASATHCPVLTGAGALKSYDGGHLTRAGAAYLGDKLRDNGGVSMPRSNSGG